VVDVRGPGLPDVAPGWHMTRIEGRVPVPTAGAAHALFATTQHLGYTSAQQQAHLARISHPGPGKVVVMIPLTKSEAWWALPQDQRQQHFAAARGHTAIGTTYADRIFRRLYHARYLPDSDWDFVTYFELHPDHVPDFRRLLAELRDPVRNPEWAYVEREVEIWMHRR
jgi:chlorite dismutase